MPCPGRLLIVIFYHRQTGWASHRKKGRQFFAGIISKEEYPEDLGEIGAFYFLPEAWGTGLAQKALHFCCSYFEKNGCQGVLLWVLEDNRRARRFYEKSGFCFDGTRRQFPAAHRICAELRYYRRLES